MGTINDMITDSVSHNTVLNNGLAPATGASMLDVVSAETVGMSMHNAVNAQNNAQITTSASIARTCAHMLGMQSAVPGKPPKKNPPPFIPLSGAPAGTPTAPKTPTDPAALIAQAEALIHQADAAIKKQNPNATQEQTELTSMVSKLKALVNPHHADGDSTPSVSAKKH